MNITKEEEVISMESGTNIMADVFVMRKVSFFKLLAYGNSTLTTVLKH